MILSFVTSGGTVLSQSEVRYDDLGRVTAKSTGNGGEEALFWEYYGYQHKMGQKTTNQLRSIQVQGEGFQKEYAYTYDTMGNIASIATENGQTRYFYDSLNQLTRVDDAAQNKTVTYSYDNGGNILSVQEYAYTNGELTGSAAVTKTYVYDANWKDKLASFDGKAITYDQIGNPISYDGWAYTWEAGRQLKSLSKAGVSIAYKYDDTGFRTQKTVNGTTTDYLVLENRILQQSDGTNTITFRYDGENKAASFDLNGTEYYYLRNLQGDIAGIVDGTGSLVVEYAYDAWGKLLSITGSLADTVGVLNPLRYRGYYYDTETGLYYLQSRYYNPEWGRFINADAAAILQLAAQSDYVLSTNLFSYCMNNPVMNYDPTGYVSMGAIIGGIIGFGVGAILIPAIADSWGLKGWKRNVFIIGGVAAVTAIGALLGHYAGKALVSLYAKGGAFAKQLNTAVAKVIGKFTKASVTSAKGNGWILKLKNYTVRIMSEGGGRTNYFRISHATKGAMTIAGAFSGNRALTHIPITVDSLFKLIKMMLRWK